MAQTKAVFGNLKFEGDVYVGKIYKHTANFKPDPTQLVKGFEISLMRQTFGSKDWHRHYNFPLVGIKINYADYGNPVLGKGISVLPFLQLKLFNVKNTQGFFSYATGLAYLTKHYDRFTDSTNNVIGSVINETSQFKFGLNHTFKNKGVLTSAIGFQHYSNAKFTSPNLGINVYSFSVGYQKFISKTPANFRTVKDILVNKKLRLDARFSYARNENQLSGGPKNPYFITYFGIHKRWCYNNRWSLGLWYQYDKGYKHQLQFYEERSDIANFTNKAAMVIGDEFIFGKLSLTGCLGYYLYENGGNQKLFQSLGVQYVLWRYNSIKQNDIYVGVQMKTHYGVAEYFETMVGIRF
ncbi:MAG: hypothetical protein RL065_1416 [Bacteroidota bacterium]|jgi:hypothetical protein